MARSHCPVQITQLDVGTARAAVSSAKGLLAEQFSLTRATQVVRRRVLVGTMTMFSGAYITCKDLPCI